MSVSGMQSFTDALPLASAPVRHPATLTINSNPVLLFSATSLALGLWITNRKVAWLARAALVGVIGYAFYDHHQLQNVQVEWFPLGDPRQPAYLQHLITWKKRISEPVEIDEESEDSKSDDGYQAISLGHSVKAFVFGEEDFQQDAYKQAWLEQMKVLEKGLHQQVGENTHHYVVGMWQGGWLQSVMLLEYAEMQQTSLETPGGEKNVLLLSLMTAPWNLRKRLGWASDLFEKGIDGLFPGGINVFCKPDWCQPPDYFTDKLKFESTKPEGVYSRTLHGIKELG